MGELNDKGAISCCHGMSRRKVMAGWRCLSPWSWRCCAECGRLPVFEKSGLFEDVPMEWQWCVVCLASPRRPRLRPGRFATLSSNLSQDKTCVQACGRFRQCIRGSPELRRESVVRTVHGSRAAETKTPELCSVVVVVVAVAVAFAY